LLRGRDVDEIKELKREGLSIRAISRLTGYDRKTISRYLLAPGGRPVYGPRPVQMGKLEPFKQYLKERLKAGVWNAQVLFRELRERNYGGGYSTLTEWLRPQRKDALTVAVRRFETLPGKQAQVDWGHLGSLSEASAEHMLWGFTITLGYSRMMMAEAATDQKLGTLLRMHESAFRQWGAVPEEILYDRMKTVWTGIDERGEIIWNAIFLDFARYWGFTPRLCRAYRPQTKGKIESGVKYVRRNFLCGLLGREPDNLRNSTVRCAAGWQRSPTVACMAQRMSRCCFVSTKICSLCSRSMAARLIRIWMTSNARWPAMLTFPGKGAVTPCPGVMRAKRSGFAIMATRSRSAMARNASRYMIGRCGNIWSSHTDSTMPAYRWASSRAARR